MIRRLFTTFALALAALAFAAAPAAAKEHQVKMLNKGADGSLMVFEPAFLHVKPGDTVKFIATTRGHNAESIAGMAPPGAKPFKGRIDEEITVRFTQEGVYGYVCLPHASMGMVGIIQVGRATNRAEASAAATKLRGLGRKRMADLLRQLR